MQTKFITFVYAEKDHLSAIYNFLKDKEYKAYLNPIKLEIEKTFSIEENTVILRPSISREPTNDKYATIEKILIDLIVELDKLWLMDRSGYKTVFDNIVFTYRIQIPKLFRYGERRKVKEEIKKYLNPPMPL